MSNENQINEIKKVINEKVGISEDVEFVELTKLVEKNIELMMTDRELQKRIDELEKKRKKEFDKLQKEIV
jgi:heme oxygenase